MHSALLHSVTRRLKRWVNGMTSTPESNNTTATEGVARTATAVQYTITDLEAAINHWRQQHPAPRDSMALCPEAAALAEQYASMIVFRQNRFELNQLSPSAHAAFVSAQSALAGQHSALQPQTPLPRAA